jgi:hypothetical protein
MTASTLSILRMSGVLAMSGAVCLSLPARAQWSSDPSVNFTVADRAGGQVQPKLGPTADGGFYVSWFGNGGDGFDVYLQRLSADGIEQWPHNGILVADRNESSTEDYGLAVDADGNALLAFQYEVAGVAQIGVSKVAADGTPLWGVPGVIVSTDASGAHSPRVAATSDGDAVVAWSGSDGSIVLQKLDGNGQPQWGDTGVVLDAPSGGFFLAGLHASDAGSVIAAWSAQLSAFDRELWTQKFAGIDGSALWGSAPVEVFDGSGGALQFGYFPDFVDDGAGGAVFVWYTVSLAGTVHAQHVLADGSPAFAQNGVDVTTDTLSSHEEPAGAFDPSTGDIYAVWRVTDAATQSQTGILAQRIDATGALAFGDTGKVLAPQSAIDQSQVDVLALPGGGALFSWVSDDFPDPMPAHVTRLDASGDAVWGAGVVDIKTAPTDTSRLAGALSARPFAAYVFEDGSGGAGEGVIKLQNIDFDGVLGLLAPDDTIFADGFEIAPP